MYSKAPAVTARGSTSTGPAPDKAIALPAVYRANLEYQSHVPFQHSRTRVIDSLTRGRRGICTLVQRQRTWGGRGGLSPPTFDKGGLSPPKIWLSMGQMKNVKYFIMPELFRMNVYNKLHEHQAPPPLLTCCLCPCSAFIYAMVYPH